MRIGITVPDELLRRVKGTWPPVNVSQVCRDALEHCAETSDRAKAQAISDGVDEHVIRLATSLKMPVIEPDWAGYALEHARDWVRTVTPEKWQQFIYQSDHLRTKGRDEAEMVGIWSQDEDGRGLLQCLLEHNEWFECQLELSFESDAVTDPYDKAREEYSRAWLGYVYEVRRSLEEHHKVERERVMAERTQYRRSRKAPELPPQLVQESRLSTREAPNTPASCAPHPGTV